MGFGGDYLRGDASLLISDLTLTDSGEYSCKVKNGAKYDWTTISLIVLGKRTRKPTHTCARTLTHARMHASGHTHTHARTLTYTHRRMPAHTHARTFTHTHTHTRKLKHTCAHDDVHTPAWPTW